MLPQPAIARLSETLRNPCDFAVIFAVIFAISFPNHQIGGQSETAGKEKISRATCQSGRTIANFKINHDPAFAIEVKARDVHHNCCCIAENTFVINLDIGERRIDTGTAEQRAIGQKLDNVAIETGGCQGARLGFRIAYFDPVIIDINLDGNNIQLILYTFSANAKFNTRGDNRSMDPSGEVWIFRVVEGLNREFDSVASQCWLSAHETRQDANHAQNRKRRLDETRQGNLTIPMVHFAVIH